MFCTANADAKTVERALALGAVDFVKKPINVDAFAGRIDRALKRAPARWESLARDDQAAARRQPHVPSAAHRSPATTSAELVQSLGRVRDGRVIGRGGRARGALVARAARARRGAQRRRHPHGAADRLPLVRARDAGGRRRPARGARRSSWPRSTRRCRAAARSSSPPPPAAPAADRARASSTPCRRCRPRSPARSTSLRWLSSRSTTPSRCCCSSSPRTATSSRGSARRSPTSRSATRCRSPCSRSSRKGGAASSSRSPTAPRRTRPPRSPRCARSLEQAMDAGVASAPAGAPAAPKPSAAPVHAAAAVDDAADILPSDVDLDLLQRLPRREPRLHHQQRGRAARARAHAGRHGGGEHRLPCLPHGEGDVGVHRARAHERVRARGRVAAVARARPRDRVHAAAAPTSRCARSTC